MLFPHVQYKQEHSLCHFWHLGNGVALNSERKLVCVSGQDIMTEYLGKSLFVPKRSIGLRFNDDVYYFMS